MGEEEGEGAFFRKFSFQYLRRNRRPSGYENDTCEIVTLIFKRAYLNYRVIRKDHAIPRFLRGSKRSRLQIPWKRNSPPCKHTNMKTGE